MSVVRTFAGAEGVSRAAAEEFTELAVEAVARSGRFTVALSGGSTPQRLYERLAEPPHRARVPWDRVEVFWGDDRLEQALAGQFQDRHGLVPAGELEQAQGQEGPGAEEKTLRRE